MFCTKCGVEISAQARFCGSCGSRLESHSGARTVEPLTLDTPTDSEPVSKAARRPATWRCPSCRRLNRPGSSGCVCGYLHESAQRVTESSAADQGQHTESESHKASITTNDPIDWDSERLGRTDKCHLCRAPRQTSGRVYEFGLGQNMKLNWSGFGIAAVAAAFGIGLQGPMRTGQIIRLRLALCDRCAREKRVWGSMLAEFSRITEADCERHPWWDGLQREGYKDFINGWKIRGYPGE